MSQNQPNPQPTQPNQATTQTAPVVTSVPNAPPAQPVANSILSDLLDRLGGWIKGKIIEHKRTLVASLAGLALGAVGYGVVSKYIKTLQTPPQPPSGTVFQPSSQPSSQPLPGAIVRPDIQRLCNEAIKLGREYVILSVVQYVHFSDTTGSDGVVRRVARFRLVYTILACKDIEPGPSTASTTNFTSFFEQIGSTNGEVRPWPGSEPEGQRDGRRAYPVDIGFMEAGEQKVIVTGADILYTLPLAKRTFLGGIACDSNQEFYSYPNDADVIGEVKIVLSSDTTLLQPANNDPYAGKYLRNGAPHPQLLKISSAGVGSIPERSLSATFKNLMPGDEAGIHFEWPQTTTPATSSALGEASKPGSI